MRYCGSEHTAAQGCRGNLTRAGSGAISTQARLQLERAEGRTYSSIGH